MRRPRGRAGLNAKVRAESSFTVLAAQYVCMEAKNAAMEAEKQRSEAEHARLAGLNERVHEEEARRRGAEDAAKLARDEVHALTERLGLAEAAAKVRVWCLDMRPWCSEMDLCVWWCCNEVLCMLKGSLVPENVLALPKWLPRRRGILQCANQAPVLGRDGGGSCLQKHGWRDVHGLLLKCVGLRAAWYFAEVPRRDARLSVEVLGVLKRCLRCQ